MRISETQVRSGFFWLPGNPDERVPGTLTITDGGRVEVDALALGHTLHSNNDRHPRVLGLIEKEGYVTLENCHVLRTTWELNAGLSRTRLHASHAFFSIHLVDNEVLMLKRFQFSVEGLDEWLEVSGIEATADWAASTATLTYKVPSPVVVSLEGKRVGFEFSWTMSPDLTEGSITQRANVSIESSEVAPLAEFTRIAYKITNFLCFALDQTVAMRSAIGTVMASAGDDPEKPTTTRIVYESLPFSEHRLTDASHRMLFGFAQIRDVIAQRLDSWFAAYDIFEPTLSLYFAAKSGAHKFTNGKFLSLAQALETYHRRISDEKTIDEGVHSALTSILLLVCPEQHKDWLIRVLVRGNEISFSKRVKRVMEHFKTILGNSDERSRLALKIATTRNYLTHYDKDLEGEAAGHAELAYLSFRMEAILQLVLLKQLGFSDDDILFITKRNPSLKWKLEVGARNV